MFDSLLVYFLERYYSYKNNLASAWARKLTTQNSFPQRPGFFMFLMWIDLFWMYIHLFLTLMCLGAFGSEFHDFQTEFLEAGQYPDFLLCAALWWPSWRLGQGLCSLFLCRFPNLQTSHHTRTMSETTHSREPLTAPSWCVVFNGLT